MPPKKRKTTTRRKGSPRRKSNRKRKRWKRVWKSRKWKLIFFIVLVVSLLPITYSSIVRLYDAYKRPDRTTIVSRDYNGIDVSRYQGKIDWPTVAQDPKIQFVYVKATEGATHHDKTYDRNIKGARSEGILVGSYHFFMANKTARQQFDNFKRHVDRSYQDLIPMVDVEEGGLHGCSRQQLQKTLAEFMELMKAEYGRYPLLYCQYSVYLHYLDPEFARYYLFVARYSPDAPRLPGATRCNIWQYSEHGRIKGIKGYVDLDRFMNGTTIESLKL